MTLFLDASALTAIIVGEDDADDLSDRIDGSDKRLTNGVAVWETAVAVARIKAVDVSAALAEVERFCAVLDVRIATIGQDEARGAVLAFGRYGKRSRHPAQLNMGDCFAYTGAQANAARLVYKGDDFRHTDLA